MHPYYAYFSFVKTESTMCISSKQYKVNTLNSKMQIQFTICRVNKLCPTSLLSKFVR